MGRRLIAYFQPLLPNVLLVALVIGVDIRLASA